MRSHCDEVLPGAIERDRGDAEKEDLQDTLRSSQCALVGYAPKLETNAPVPLTQYCNCGEGRCNEPVALLDSSANIIAATQLMCTEVFVLSGDRRDGGEISLATVIICLRGSMMDY